MNLPLHLSPRQMAGLTLPPVQPPHSPAPYLVPEVGCNAERVQLAGGFIASLLVNPMLVPFEQLYRREADEGMFLDEVSPENPFAFELGAFRVPADMALLIFDIRPDIYRFSGVDAGDAVPVEARRYSSQLGFDLTVDQQRQGNTLFQLNPVPIQTFPQAFQPQGLNGQDLPAGMRAALAAANQPQFNISAASSFASPSGPGTALQPQRPTRFGPLSVPFTLYARQNQTVQARCVIWEPLSSPIAFIEYDIAGMLLPEQYLNALIECMKPLTNASGGPGSLGPGPR